MTGKRERARKPYPYKRTWRQMARIPIFFQRSVETHGICPCIFAEGVVSCLHSTVDARVDKDGSPTVPLKCGFFAGDRSFPNSFQT